MKSNRRNKRGGFSVEPLSGLALPALFLALRKYMDTRSKSKKGGTRRRR